MTKTKRSQIIDSLADVRTQSPIHLKKLNIPTVKDEEWKYTNLSALGEIAFSLPKKDKLKSSKLIDRYLSKKDINIVFVNGEISNELSNFKNQKGLTIKLLSESLKDKTVQSVLARYTQENTFDQLNKALNTEGIFIEADKNAAIEKLIHIVHITSSKKEKAIVSPRAFIYLRKSAQLQVLESHITPETDSVYFANALTDIYLEENAALRYCKAQSESTQAFHIGRTRVWQERSSNFEGFSLMNGGILTRNNLDITLDGEGASAILNGLYCVTGNQLVDNHSAVDHRQPNCTSNQYYKGILNGASRGVFNGKIFVKPIAQKTNSYQLNKNLLLGREALINTKPQLEIFADDVKCTHGATIGQLNEDEIFYLQSRCISQQTAIKMLSQAFIDDILQTVTQPAITDKLHIILEPTIAQF